MNKQVYNFGDISLSYEDVNPIGNKEGYRFNRVIILRDVIVGSEKYSAGTFLTSLDLFIPRPIKDQYGDGTFIKNFTLL